MAEENKKKISERPLIVFLLSVTGLAFLLTILALIDEQGFSTVIGSYFIYGGMFVATIGLLLLKGSSERGTSLAKINYVKNSEYFKRAKKEEKPFIRIVWPVIFAALSVMAIGYSTTILWVG